MKEKIISCFYIIAGLYDGILGIIFLFMPLAIFNYFKVEPPNHLGYIHFPALLLITFAIMFFVIAKSPIKNRNLIPYGILLKISYCLVVFGYWFTSGIPNMWKPFAICDFIFGVLFFITFLQLKKDN